MRGRRGTEWAMTHASGEAFALLDPGTLQRIDLMESLRGSAIEVRCARPGDSGLDVSAVAGGEALRPPSPVHLFAVQTPSGAVEANWTRRSRHGWAWHDELDAPLGEARERYLVTLTGTGSSIAAESDGAGMTFDPAEVAAVGSGAAILSVQQQGDLAYSRAAATPLSLT
ncbi:MAG: hypothetical protein ABIO69_02595 [Sphingomicrobium sp.]